MRRALALAAILLGACGDDPCGECPAGTRCVQVPSGDIATQRFECQQTVKVIDRKWLLSSPPQ